MTRGSNPPSSRRKNSARSPSSGDGISTTTSNRPGRLFTAGSSLSGWFVVAISSRPAGRGAAVGFDAVDQVQERRDVGVLQQPVQVLDDEHGRRLLPPPADDLLEVVGVEVRRGPQQHAGDLRKSVADQSDEARLPVPRRPVQQHAAPVRHAQGAVERRDVVVEEPQDVRLDPLPQRSGEDQVVRGPRSRHRRPVAVRAHRARPATPAGRRRDGAARLRAAAAGIARWTAGAQPQVAVHAAVGVHPDATAPARPRAPAGGGTPRPTAPPSRRRA